MIVLILLETGEFRIGKAGKSNYAVYSYTIRNDQLEILINTEQHPENAPAAMTYLLQKLEKNWGLDNAALVLPRPNQNRVIITIQGWEKLKSQAKPGSALAFAMQIPQMLLDLTSHKRDDVALAINKIMNGECQQFEVQQLDMHFICTPSLILSPRYAQILANSLLEAIKTIGASGFNATQLEQAVTIQPHRNAENDRDLFSVVIPSNIAENLNTKIITRPPIFPHLAPQREPEAINADNPYLNIILRRVVLNISNPNDLLGKKQAIEDYANLVARSAPEEKHVIKKLSLLEIVRLFIRMTNLTEIADLFDTFLQCQPRLDFHTHDFIDIIFRINNTASWQEAESIIRNHSYYLLHQRATNFISDGKITDAQQELNTYHNRSLFTHPWGNGIASLGSTEAAKEIARTIEENNRLLGNASKPKAAA